MDHDYRERKDRQRPQGVRRNGQQRGDRRAARREDAEPATVGVASKQREACGDLERTQDQRDPAPGVEIAEDVGRVLGEDFESEIAAMP
jgi:hypothetical protein